MAIQGDWTNVGRISAARGQNRRDFVAGLVARGYAMAITHGSVRRGRVYHVHHKPLYEVIGEPDSWG